VPCPRIQQANLPAYFQAGKLWMPTFQVFWSDSAKKSNLGLPTTIDFLNVWLIPSSSQTKRLKKLIFTASCLTFSGKGMVWRTSRQVCLCLWTRDLTGLPLPWVVRQVLTGGSLIRKSKRSLRCLLVEIPWRIKEQVPLVSRQINRKASSVCFLLLCIEDCDLSNGLSCCSKQSFWSPLILILIVVYQKRQIVCVPLGKALLSLYFFKTNLIYSINVEFQKVSLNI